MTEVDKANSNCEVKRCKNAGNDKVDVFEKV